MLEVNAQFARDTGAEILNDDIAVTDQVVENLQTGLTLKINRDALLVSVQGHKIGTLPLQRIPGIVGK